MIEASATRPVRERGDAARLREELRLLRALMRGRFNLAAIWSRIRAYPRIRRAVIRDRLTPQELRGLGADANHVVADRDAWFLQADLRAARPMRLPQAQMLTLRSKARFALDCAAQGLAHPPTHVLPKGAGRTLGVLDLPVFLKPDIGHHARGAAVLVGTGTAATLTSAAGIFRGDVATLLSHHLPGEQLVAQPVLSNAPSLAEIVGPVAATFRVVTGRMGGQFGILSMLAELPLGEALPLPQRWEVRRVNFETGRLGPPMRARPPGTNDRQVPLEGTVLPQITQMATLAARAHDLLTSELPLVGWDLVAGPAGPVLLEGNVDWAVLPHLLTPEGPDQEMARRFAAVAAAAISGSA